MKSFVKIIFFFIMLFFAFCNCSQDVFSSDIQAVNYIQNEYPKVTFVSNPFNVGEIFSNTNDDKSSSLLGKTFFSIKNLDNINLSKNISHLDGKSIHNLSTDKKSCGFIRAP